MPNDANHLSLPPREMFATWKLKRGRGFPFFIGLQGAIPGGFRDTAAT
jgi:hypothetical protein